MKITVYRKKDSLKYDCKRSMFTNLPWCIFFYMASHIFTFNCTARLILLQVAVQSIYNLMEVAGLHSLGMSPVMECGNRAITHSTSKFGMTSATSFCSHLNIAYSIVMSGLSIHLQPEGGCRAAAPQKRAR